MQSSAQLGLLLRTVIISVCLSAPTVAQNAVRPQSQPPAATATPASRLTSSPPAATVNSTTAPSADSPTQRRAQNAELLRAAKQQLDANPADVAAADAVSLYAALDTTYAQMEAVDQQVGDLQTRQADLQKRIQSGPKPGTDKNESTSFVDFDRLENELAAEQARTELVGVRVKAAKTALEEAQTAFDQREQERRQAQESVDNAKTGSDSTTLAADLAQAKQSSLLAATTLVLRQKELAQEKLSATVEDLIVKLMGERVNRLRPLVVFSRDDLDDQLKTIKSQEDKLRTELDKAQKSKPVVQTKVADIKRRAEAATGDRTLLREEWKAQRSTLDKLQDQTDIALTQLQQLDQMRIAWNRLFQLGSGGSPPTADMLQDWEQDNAAALRDLHDSTQAHLLRIEELRSQLATVTAKADGAKDGPPELARWIEQQRVNVEEMIRLQESSLATIDVSRRLHNKLRTDIGHDAELLSPRRLVRAAWQQVAQLWDLELGAPEDRSITPGKILKSLILFAAGWIMSRVVSNFFANRLLERQFHLGKDVIAVIKSVVFYGLVVVAGLEALNWANVPLTAFTILGGAVAISVGFGSQALINNFLSGLIMLAERPVRIGERVIFGKYDGVVEDVGFRCTKLRTGTDHVVTIPNSSLLNESIENVGRRRSIQRTFDLAIGYDTPRDRIQQAVEAIREILEEPGIREPIHPLIGWEKNVPRVHFTDYHGDHLSIQVVYNFAPPNHWDYMAHAERINLRIFEEFERLGVSFAAPSKTVYIGPDVISPPVRRAG